MSGTYNDPLILAWDTAVDELAARARKLAKAKIRDLVETGIVFAEDATPPFKIPRIVFALLVQDQFEFPDEWKPTVEKIKPHI